MRNIRNGDYMLRKLENEIVKECAPTLAELRWLIFLIIDLYQKMNSILRLRLPI